MPQTVYWDCITPTPTKELGECGVSAAAWYGKRASFGSKIVVIVCKISPDLSGCCARIRMPRKCFCYGECKADI